MSTVAIVTGGTRGIGEAICLSLRDMGMTVAANFANDHLRAAEFEARNGIRTFQWDVANFDACQTGVEMVEQEIGPVAVLVNNAGITRDGSIGKMSEQNWRDVVETNLGGCFNMSKAVFAGMRDRKSGRIVNISSINGQAGQFGQVNYSAAKAGIHGFSKALAREGARLGITVNTVAPGYTETDMVAAVPTAVLDQIRSNVPTGRFSTPAEIARVVAFLCHQDSGQITGSTITINGGHYMD